MRHPVDHLSTSSQPDVPTARPGKDEPDVLARRLRGLPANHPSATIKAERNRRIDHKGETRRDDVPSRDRDSPATSETDAFAENFWSRAGHFEDLWKAHQERWPRPPARDRSRADDPPGSWRGDGDRFLTRDENAQAEVAIATMRECEPEVTELLLQLEQKSPFGARLVGLEHRLKGADRLKEKIVDGMRAAQGVSVEDAAGQISDAVRFTYRLEPRSYSPGYADMCTRMQAAGYQQLPSKNYWHGGQDYRGINSRWMTPKGARFELQFHTAESHYAKEFLTHGSYNRLRSPETGRAERKALNAYQALVCDAIPTPPGVDEIDDTRNLS